MSKMSRYFLLVATATLLLSFAAAAQPAITNHSFEVEYWTGTWADHWPGYFGALGTPPGWTPDGGGGIGFQDDGGFGQGSGPAPDGTYFAFIQGSGSLRQGLAFVEGEMYEIRLHARTRVGTDAVNSQVRVGTETLYSTSNFAPANFVEIVVPPFVYNNAQGNELAIVSESATGGDAALLFDNVRVLLLQPPAVLGSGTDGVGDTEPFLNPTITFDAPAGENRLLVITTGTRDNTGDPQRVLPAAVGCEIDGGGQTPMIKGRERVSPDWETGRIGTALWYLPIGDSATDQSVSVTVNFDSSDDMGGIIGWWVIEDIDQANPRGTVPKGNTSGGVTAVHTSGDVAEVPSEWIVVGADTARDALTVSFAGSGQTVAYETQTPPANIMHVGSYRVVADRPTETVNLQIGADADAPWAMVAVAFKGVTAEDGLGGGDTGSAFELTYTGSNPVARAQGYNLVIEVVPVGNTGVVTYQWFKRLPDLSFELLPGETFETLVFEPIALTDAGIYMCQAMDDYDLAVAQSPLITVIVGEKMPAGGVLGMAALAAIFGMGGVSMLRRRRA